MFSSTFALAFSPALFIARIASKVPSNAFVAPIQLPTIDDNIHPLPVINGIISSPPLIAIVVFPLLKISIGPLANIIVFNFSAVLAIISPFSFKVSLVMISSSQTSTPFAVFVSSITLNILAIVVIS